MTKKYCVIPSFSCSNCLLGNGEMNYFFDNEIFITIILKSYQLINPLDRGVTLSFALDVGAHLYMEDIKRTVPPGEDSQEFKFQI